MVCGVAHAPLRYLCLQYQYAGLSATDGLKGGMPSGPHVPALTHP